MSSILEIGYFCTYIEIFIDSDLKITVNSFLITGTIALWSIELKMPSLPRRPNCCSTIILTENVLCTLSCFRYNLALKLGNLPNPLLKTDGNSEINSLIIKVVFNVLSLLISLTVVPFVIAYFT